MKTPCKNCTKREFACHGKCEEYKAFRAVCDSINNSRQKAVHERDSEVQHVTSRKKRFNTSGKFPY